MPRLVVTTIVYTIFFFCGASIASFLVWYVENNDEEDVGTELEHSAGPKKKRVLPRRSVCNHCGRPLGVLELIPVVGWILLRGRSRCCHKPIPIRYPLIELAFGMAFVLLMSRSKDFAILLHLYPRVDEYFGLWPTVMSIMVLGAFVWLVLLALYDLRHMTVPRIAVDIAVIAGLAYKLVAYIYPGFVVGSVYTPVVVASKSMYHVMDWFGLGLLGLMAVLTVLRKFGLGDTLVFIVLYLFFGGALMSVSFAIAVLAGGAFGIILLLLGRLDCKRGGHHVPFVPFIAVSFFLSVFFLTEVMDWLMKFFWIY